MHQRTCFSRSLCVLDSKSSFRETSPPGGHRDDARRLPYCSGEPQSRCHFRKECSREKSFCPNKARFPGRPVPRKSPVPRCLSRLRRARAPDLTNHPPQPPASFPSSPQAHPPRSPPPENAGGWSPASKRKSSNLSLHSRGKWCNPEDTGSAPDGFIWERGTSASQRASCLLPPEISVSALAIPF